MHSVAIETEGWVRSIMGWQTVGHPLILSVVLYRATITQYICTVVCTDQYFYNNNSPNGYV